MEEGLDGKASQQRQRGWGWETPHWPGWVLTVPLPPAKSPVVPPARQYLHGAQGHQLHKGVCPDFMDPVVLETTDKTETGLRKYLKAAFVLCRDLCPMAADANCHSGSCHLRLGGLL